MAVCVSISSEPEAWIIVSLTWQWHYSRLAIPNRGKTVMPTIRASVLPWIATLAFLFTGSRLIKTQTYCWNCTFCFVFFCLLRYLRLFIILFWSGRWNIFGVFVVYYAKAFKGFFSWDESGSHELKWVWQTLSLEIFTFAFKTHLKIRHFENQARLNLSLKCIVV